MRNLQRSIIKLVSEITGIPESKITLDSHISKDLDIDSFKALEVVFKIEKKFRIDIPINSLDRVTTVRELVEVVRRLLKE